MIGPAPASAPPAASPRPPQGAAVLPVAGRRALRRFAALPRLLYRDDPRWTPPLVSEEVRFLGPRNPYVRGNPTRLFLATRDGRPVGRVAATVCRGHNTYHGEQTAFFGFFESERSAETAGRLLDAAAAWAREQGMETLRGPTNFTTNHTCGLLVTGFDGPAQIDMPYNPPWYEDLLQEWGLSPVKDLLAYWADLADGLPAQRFLDRVGRRPGADRFRVRPMRTKGRELWEDMALFSDLYHDAWKDNWGFVPLEGEELDYLVERMEPVLEPRLAHLGFEGDRPAGLFMAIPDYNQVLRVLGGRLTPLGIVRSLRARRRIDSGRLLLGGVYEPYRRTPLPTLLFRRCLEGARELGYQGMEISWILDDNRGANGFLRPMDLPVYRRYRIFEKAL